MWEDPLFLRNTITKWDGSKAADDFNTTMEAELSANENEFFQILSHRAMARMRDGAQFKIKDVSDDGEKIYADVTVYYGGVEVTSCDQIQIESDHTAEMRFTISKKNGETTYKVIDHKEIREDEDDDRDVDLSKIDLGNSPF